MLMKVLLLMALLMINGCLSLAIDVKYLDGSFDEILGGNPNYQLSFVLCQVEGTSLPYVRHFYSI
jgi:hypothetical protein